MYGGSTHAGAPRDAAWEWRAVSADAAGDRSVPPPPRPPYPPCARTSPAHVPTRVPTHVPIPC